MNLNPVTLRVLGSLMEKEMTTPEAYPLSLNSLLAACNQKTSRDPVLELFEEEVRSALETLRAQDLVSVSRDARVPKFEHRIRTVLNLRRDETAILCLLLLRGPQTAGELRGRADRMFSFDDSPAVQSALDRLAGREAPLVAALSRVPGTREVRFMHLLGDPAAALATRSPADSAQTEEPATPLLAHLIQRVSALEARVQRLESNLEVPAQSHPVPAGSASS